MPIYAYRCATCGNAKDVLQKMSDPVLTVCPFCGAATFEKQVTAAGFQLKGSGWYVTDFRGDTKPPAAAGPVEPKSEGAGKPEGGKPDSAKTDSAKTDSGKTDGGKSAPSAPAAGKGDGSASPAPAPAPSSDKK